MNQLKGSIATRYENLKHSFDREYLMADKERDSTKKDKSKSNAGFEPLKSPCFDIQPKPMSASLKDRIKLNKDITRSPTTGGLRGVTAR